jgi:hypothetical protein
MMYIRKLNVAIRKLMSFFAQSCRFSQIDVAFPLRHLFAFLVSFIYSGQLVTN